MVGPWALRVWATKDQLDLVPANPWTSSTGRVVDAVEAFTGGEELLAPSKPPATIRRGLATYDAEHVSNYPRSFYRFTVRPVGGDSST
jgi:hypothetical protein